MPKRAASGSVVRRKKPRLHSIHQINEEIRRLYRRIDFGELSEAAALRRINILIALRNGMPADAPGDAYPPSEIRILAVPSACYLDEAQAKAVREGRSIIDVDQCTPMQLTDGNQTNKTLQITEQTNSDETLRRELRNAHFRPEFHDLPVAPQVAERRVDVATPQPVEDYHNMLLRKAREDEANGKCRIMRAPREAVRWPKPPGI